MARRRRAERRTPAPDPKYNSELIGRIINYVMEKGKKSTAESIVYGAFEIIAHRLKDDPVKIFEKALSNIKPRLEVKSRRVGGSTYQVPVDVRPDRALALSMRWLILHSRKRGEKTMREKLAFELMDAASGRGAAVKKREDTHKMAEANKAFAHYRW